MSIEDFSAGVDISNGIGNSNDKISEISEIFKEAVKKGSAGIKRTQKDEKKAKKHDMLLANFLVKIIINKKYDNLLETLFKAIDEGYTSNFLLGILSIIDIEISNKIRELSSKKEIEFHYNKTPNKIEFDDNELDKKVRNRINHWVEDIIDIISIEYSSLLTQNLLDLLKEDQLIAEFTSKVFKFFLDDINITIEDNKSLNISYFIIGEIKKSIRNLDLEEI